MQKQIFGDAIQYIDLVYCYGAASLNPQPRLCSEKGIRGTPTWEIKGKLIVGCMSLEKIAQLSGYEGPLPSESSSP